LTGFTEVFLMMNSYYKPSGRVLQDDPVRISSSG